MGMSTYVQGIKPPDEHWQKMRDAWQACSDAGVSIPKELVAFFGDDAHTIDGPDPRGVVVELGEIHDDDNLHDFVSLYRTGNQNGFEIDVDHIPKDIKIIRFIKGW